MNDTKYRLIDNLPNGDCFFLALVKALKTKDIHTSVKDLRGRLSEEITQEHFEKIIKEDINDFNKEAQRLYTEGTAIRESRKTYEASVKKNKRCKKGKTIIIRI